jgi:hypothetical protein
MTKKHNTQKTKLNKLRQEQNNNTIEQISFHKFYPKVINHTNIQLTNNEIQLLNKGPKYNLHYTNNTWLETIAIEAEIAISHTEDTQQNYLRHAVAKTINTILNKKKGNNNTHVVSEWKTLKNIKKKLKEHNAIITQADKGKTIVIITEEEYNKHIKNYIDTNHFTKINNNPTNTYQNNVKRTIKLCKESIPKNKQWLYYHMNPSPPNIRAQIKIHKTPNTIRPVVNWCNAPAYKLAKQLTKTLHTLIQLPDAYNITNTAHLIKDLNNIPININTRMCSFDITNMYTNIPTKKVSEIIKEILNNSHEQHNKKHEILNMTHTVIDQNFFTFNNEFYKQQTGLAMGAPSSAILAEIYLQSVEHHEIYDILIKNKIKGYFRYVDDILIVYDTDTTNINNVLHQFNNIHADIQYTKEDEINNTINFLDVTIHRTEKKLTYNIYRKPTTTDTMIHYTSCHPKQHKLSGIQYLTNRLHTYPLNENAKKKEQNIIKQILTQNSYPPNIHNTQKIKPKQISPTISQTNKQEKRAIFTYFGHETYKITKIFKDTQLKIAYRTNNTIQHHLFTKQPKKQDKYENSGIYSMKCLDCPQQYIGQTGRPFKIRFKEHIRAIKHNPDASTYAQHITNNRHTYGSIHDTMDILKITQKGRQMNILEKFYIYCAHRENIHMNEFLHDTNNPIFNTLYEQYNTGKPHR